MHLLDFFETVYFPKRLRGKSERSLILYRLCVKRFSESLGRTAEVADLTEANVLLHLSKRRNVAPATRNKELTQLLAMWRQAVRQNLLTDWPDIDEEHEPERAPIAWMEPQIRQLLESAATTKGELSGVPACLWWPGLIRLMLDTGERIGAIRKVEWTWYQGDWLLVPAEVRKGKTRDRRYRLSDETCETVEQIRKYSGNGTAILPWPYVENYLFNRYQKIVKAAGLPTGRKYQTHCLRKTTGSVVYAAGMDPQETLDHSDRRTTQRYLDPRYTRQRQACDALAEFLGNPQSDRRKGSARRKTG